TAIISPFRALPLFSSKIKCAQCNVATSAIYTQIQEKHTSARKLPSPTHTPYHAVQPSSRHYPRSRCNVCGGGTSTPNSSARR
ncbi:hypothetical protein B0H15DRAFT_1022291, partial [Mycena belliarum]